VPTTALRNLVRPRPVLAFFVLAFGLSWLAWTPYVLSRNGTGILPFAFPAVLGTPQLLGVLPGAYLGPVTAAFLVTALVEGRAGLRSWRGRLLRFRVGWRWYAGVVVVVPVAVLATTLLLPGALAAARPVGLTLLLAYVPMLLLQVVTTALAEEPGWRDFALPRLQDRFGPVPGTVVLGLLWGAWHLPLFLTQWGGTDVTWDRPVLFVAACVPLSLVMTWVFNRTGQSVPVVMLLHAGINSTYTLLWPAIFAGLEDLDRSASLVQLLASGAATVVLLVATRGRLGLSPRAVRTAPSSTVLVRE
jgi:membrane protease YdiL (CAAX protease family)